MWNPVIAVAVWTIGGLCLFALILWALRLIARGSDEYSAWLDEYPEEGYDPITRREM